MPQFPDGTKFQISDGAETPAFTDVIGFNGLGGDIGSESNLIDTSTLSDTQKKYGASGRKDGGERKIEFQYDKDDPGQKLVRTSAIALNERDCKVILPSGETWSFKAIFAGWTLSEPEAEKPLSMMVKIGINTDGGLA